MEFIAIQWKWVRWWNNSCCVCVECVCVCVTSVVWWCVGAIRAGQPVSVSQNPHRRLSNKSYPPTRREVGALAPNNGLSLVAFNCGMLFTDACVSVNRWMKEAPPRSEWAASDTVQPSSPSHTSALSHSALRLYCVSASPTFISLFLIFHLLIYSLSFLYLFSLSLSFSELFFQNFYLHWDYKQPNSIPANTSHPKKCLKQTGSSSRHTLKIY